MALLILFLAPAGLSQTPEEVLKSFVGQKLILRHIGEKMAAKVEKNDLAQVTGSCDIAVQVRETAWREGTARFSLEDIGTPSLSGNQIICKERHNEHLVDITGFENNEPADSLTASVRELLQTPEQYLAAHGIKFEYPQASGDNPLIHVQSQPTRPRLILSVDPTYSKQARKEKFQGTVTCAVIIGTDGHAHAPQISRAAGHGLDEQAMRIIPMWLFEPGRQLDKPVDVRVSIEISFKLY